MTKPNKNTEKTHANLVVNVRFHRKGTMINKLRSFYDETFTTLSEKETQTAASITLLFSCIFSPHWALMQE